MSLGIATLNKMQIIHLVLGKANPNRMNGVNKVVHNLATTQTELGYNTKVWGITPTPNDTADLPTRNFKTELFQKPSSKLKIDASLKTAVHNLPKDTVFHIHGGFIPEFYTLHKALVQKKVPYIVTPHGCYNVESMNKNSKWIKKMYFSFFERTFLKKSKTLHCIGESEMTAANKLVPTVEKVLIPNGQSFEDLQFEFSPVKKDEELIFGFCGRMDMHMKGLDYLLNGFADYKHEMNGSGKLWMIGGNQDFETLKQMARGLKIDDAVKFWGPRYGDEKNNLLANMDAFYHSSRYEGMPTAILEAAALGVPCVVSEATNLAKYIDLHDAGLALVKNDAQNVAQSFKTIETLKKNQQLYKKSENAKRMVETVFNWEAVSKDLIQVYAA